MIIVRLTYVIMYARFTHIMVFVRCIHNNIVYDLRTCYNLCMIYIYNDMCTIYIYSDLKPLFYEKRRLWYWSYRIVKVFISFRLTADPLCLSCTNVASPSSCTSVAKCGTYDVSTIFMNQFSHFSLLY